MNASEIKRYIVHGSYIEDCSITQSNADMVMAADYDSLAAANVRLQRLLDMRPPYYCHQCRCASCGNTFMVEK